MNGLLGIVAFAMAIAFVVYGLRAITFFLERQFRKAIIPFIISFVCACPFVFFFAFVISAVNREGNKTLCIRNLATIGKASQLYTQNHTNFPSSLQCLTNVLNTAGEFICPVSGHKAGALTNVTEWTDYYFVAGLKESDPHECLLAYCNCPKHKQGIVLSVDGAVTFYPPNDFQKLTNSFGITNQTILSEIKSRVRIVRGNKQISSH